jgi:hypothetical protein
MAAKAKSKAKTKAKAKAKGRKGKRAGLAAAVSSHPSPIYKHVPGGGLERCIWNPDENEYDCEAIDASEIPNGAGIFPTK